MPKLGLPNKNVVNVTWDFSVLNFQDLIHSNLAVYLRNSVLGTKEECADRIGDIIDTPEDIDGLRQKYYGYGAELPMVFTCPKDKTGDSIVVETLDSSPVKIYEVEALAYDLSWYYFKSIQKIMYKLTKAHFYPGSFQTPWRFADNAVDGILPDHQFSWNAIAGDPSDNTADVYLKVYPELAVDQNYNGVLVKEIFIWPVPDHVTYSTGLIVYAEKWTGDSWAYWSCPPTETLTDQYIQSLLQSGNPITFLCDNLYEISMVSIGTNAEAPYNHVAIREVQIAAYQCPALPIFVSNNNYEYANRNIDHKDQETVTCGDKTKSDLDHRIKG